MSADILPGTRSRIFRNNVKSSSASLLPRNPEVIAFHKSLPNYGRTPLVSLPGIAQELGIGRLLVKDESQRFGLTAFKILGASYATYRALTKKLGLKESTSQCTGEPVTLESLASAAQAAQITLFAATDGNHGRAVSRMAKYLGINAVIYVPSMLDEEAKSKISAEGAMVKVHDGDYDQTVLATKAAAENQAGGKGLLISDTALTPEDEIAGWIVEGYQTMFDEIEEQIRDKTGQNDISLVVTPVGVGSLAQAVVTNFARIYNGKRTSIATVEPQTASCLKASLEAGKMVSVNAEYTICTGMCCGTLSAIGWPILHHGVDVAVAVQDHEVHRAINELEEYGVYAGPCGAASLAGLRYLIEMSDFKLGPESVVVILCTEGRRGYHLRQ